MVRGAHRPFHQLVQWPDRLALSEQLAERCGARGAHHRRPDVELLLQRLEAHALDAHTARRQRPDRALLRGAQIGTHLDGAVVLDIEQRSPLERNLCGVAERHPLAALVDAVGAREDAEQRHQVFRPARQWTGGEVAQHLVLGHRVLPRAGHEPTRCLVAEHAVEEGRAPDGAADVGAQPERRCARADDRALATGAATRDATRVVGVVRAAVDVVVRLHPHAQLGRVRHAERNGAGFAQPRDGRGIAVGDHVPTAHQPGGVRHAGQRERLLDGAGDAVQRRQLAAAPGERVGLVGFGARLLEAIAHHGVQRWIDALDLLDVGIDGFARGQPALADQPGNLQGGQQAGISHQGAQARSAYLGPQTPE